MVSTILSVRDKHQRVREPNNLTLMAVLVPRLISPSRRLQLLIPNDSGNIGDVSASGDES